MIMYISSVRRVPEHSKSSTLKTFLVLECDQCKKIFEQGNNVKLIRSKPRHYCNLDCHKLAMKSGGVADASRKKTCREKYGVNYLINHPHMLERAARAGQTESAWKKRRATRDKAMKDLSVQLKRGLILYRSRAEVAFLDALSKRFNVSVHPQKYVNGRWIDGYVEAWDLYIQFDGVYWHSFPDRQRVDDEQNEWFRTNGKKLIRISDRDWAADPEKCLKLFEAYVTKC